MKFTKIEETPKALIYQADCSQDEIYGKVRMLISNQRSSQKNDPFYYLKYPSAIFKPFINYFRVKLNSDHIYFPQRSTTPVILIYFENSSDGNTKLTFKASYLPVFRVAFFISIPAALYFAYQMISSDHSTKMILVTIGFCLMIWLFIGSITFIHERSLSYYFKRAANMIINDLSGIANEDQLNTNSIWAKSGKFIGRILKK